VPSVRPEKPLVTVSHDWSLVADQEQKRSGKLAVTLTPMVPVVAAELILLVVGLSP
jgi:hypothetical protein